MIIIFDSGIGGFDLVNKLMQLQDLKQVTSPSSELFLEIFYYADKKNFPYGNKTKGELKSAISEIFEMFASKNPSCIIVACNTASIITEELFPNKKYKNIPIFDMLSALKFFASKEEKLTILSTILTAQYLSSNPTYQSHEIIGLSNLAQAIENLDYKSIEKQISELKLSQKTLYACTHFPLMDERFKKYFPIEFINPIEKIIEKIIEKMHEKQKQNFNPAANIKLIFAQNSIEKKYYALYSQKNK